MMIWFIVSLTFFWFIGFWILHQVPVCQLESKFSHPIPKISIIIPARNEASNLPKLLESLNHQSIRADEIIVVNDHSSDDTASIARRFDAQIINSETLPNDWLGKPWSCYQGFKYAKGELLIFLDADTFLEKDGLKRIISTFIQKRGVISILPYHQIKKFHESFSAFFNIIQLIGMNYFTINKNNKPAGMFGPCVIISRKDYMASGGHDVVKNEILEHYKLAKYIQDKNIPIHLYGGKHTINIRMYKEDFKALIQGWTKSFAAGAKNTPRKLFYFINMWLSGLLISVILVLTSLITQNTSVFYFSLIIYFFYVFQVYIQSQKAGHFPLWSAVFYPLNLVFFFIIFFRAGYKAYKNEKTIWKDRNIS